jgi:mannose-1-phosphate guanylyltransferase
MANASRCPDLVQAEIEAATGRACGMCFEPRPLGAVGTLARLKAAGGDGAWLVLNTDMVTGMDFGRMIEAHLSSGAHWTAATGDFPSTGSYGGLQVDVEGSFGGGPGVPRHFQGASIMGWEVLALSGELRTGSLFGDLAGLSAARGLVLRAWESGAEWLDTGTPDSYRRALLSKGSFVHPSADISEGATLGGAWFISGGCRVGAGCRIRDSVMLDGSSLVSGALVEDVLPWHCEWRQQSEDA